MFKSYRLPLLFALLLPGMTFAGPQAISLPAQNPATAPATLTGGQPANQQVAPQDQPTVHTRVRPLCSVRLGGVFTLGLSDSGVPAEESAALGKPLSAANADWIAANCDVAALNTVNITPDTYRAMRAAQPLFTPLLYVYASTLYEQPVHRGNVGGWNTQMAAYTLRDAHGAEVPHPDQGGHWMDFGSREWATHWRDQVAELVSRYGAQGVVAAELPINNTAVRGKLQKYAGTADRVQATTAWLTAARAPDRYLMVPSALGFDALAGHSTLAAAPEVDEPELRGRLWDDYLPLTDGGWVEGWVRPYWTSGPLREEDWERQLEAADRAGFLGQVFIAAAAYHNTAELEYALASYLLIVRPSGRVVFQPMPLLPGQRSDIGYSLTMLQREVEAHSAYFNMRLGPPLQQRHPVPAQGGDVWRRSFIRGIVYVNSSDQRTATLLLGNTMKRLDGRRVNKVILPPHSGVILVYR
jgi:hypothetical protein